MQGDAEPHLVGVGLVDAVPRQEIADGVCAVDLEADGGALVALGQPEVVKHRADVQQLEVRPQSAALALQRSVEEHPPGMVEQHVVFGVADEVGDLAHHGGVGDPDAGNGFD